MKKNFILSSPNAAKKSKSTEKEPVENTVLDSSTTQSDPDPSKSYDKRFQTKWLTDKRFKNWLVHDGAMPFHAKFVMLENGEEQSVCHRVREF